MARTYEDIQDELLVIRSREGDADSLRVLVRRWQPRLTRLAWRLTADRDAARDIAQETWLAIVRGLVRLDDPARFRAWAYRIVTNKCADWTRRRTARRRAMTKVRADATTCTESESQCGGQDDVTRLRAAMRRLPDEHRALLSLRYLDGLSVAELGDALGIAQGTVKSRLHHARKRLKQYMEKMR